MASNGEGATTSGAADKHLATETTESKGKGKAAASDVPQDHPMAEEAEDDDDDEEEEEEEAEVRSDCLHFAPQNKRNTRHES